MRMIDADKLKEAITERIFESYIKEYQWVCNVIDSQPTVSQWIPVTERLPEMEEDVLVALNWGAIDIACRYEDIWLADVCNYFNEEIKAWMPLSLARPYSENDK